MSTPGKRVKKAEKLVLHCKCDQCSKWEFENVGHEYFLVCVTCYERVSLGSLISIDPHAKLHWEKE